MNGATTDPLVSMMRPPKISIMITIGISQNFLRVRKKSQNSTRKDKVQFS
jgi:hypothetical protein